MRNKLKLPALMLGLALLATPLVATTVQKMELPQLVSMADNIVQGRVESVEARYEQNRIYTYISVVVDDPIKGNRRQSVLIRQVGGTIGNRFLWIAGMPQYKASDEVILFLKTRQDGMFDVIGLNQGKYDIVNNYAVTNVSGITLMDPKTGVLSDAGFSEKAPLETFKAKIKELMR